MTRQTIPFDEFNINACKIWGKDWLLLTSGSLSQATFNMMTVAWGAIGVMWSKPFAQVVVRPSRHTYQFMEAFDDFTLSAFPKEHRQVLQYCGAHSGRDGDKAAACGIHPILSETVASPGFEEASLIVECRKIYLDDMNPENFKSDAAVEAYRDGDYHRIYYGEITHISGTADYRV